LQSLYSTPTSINTVKYGTRKSVALRAAKALQKYWRCKDAVKALEKRYKRDTNALQKRCQAVQCAAKRCNTLQYAAKRCKVLRNAAKRSKTMLRRCKALHKRCKAVQSGAKATHKRCESTA
jgi:hypothetical protein